MRSPAVRALSASGLSRHGARYVAGQCPDSALDDGLVVQPMVRGPPPP
jgi:hypothetical protein